MPRLLDYGARSYDPLTCSWTTPDPLAHKYLSWSPYSFTAANPVNFVDMDGNDIWRFDINGRLIDAYPIKDNSFDIFMIVVQNGFGEWNEVPCKAIYMPLGTVKQLNDESPMFSFSNDAYAHSTFETMANNTKVEWSLVTFIDGTRAEVGTSCKASSNSTAIKSVRGRESILSSVIHSHPYEPYPSSSDKSFYLEVKKKASMSECQFMIFHVLSGRYIRFNELGPLYDDEMFELE